jgi:tetratricopeptide (TPR) repeat protein
MTGTDGQLSKTETSELPQLLEQGFAHHQQGNLAAAEPLYLRVLQSAPNHFDAQHMLGMLRYQQGRLTEAADLLSRALQINPESVHALTNYGAVLYLMARFEEAVASYDKALAIDPQNAEALNNRGNALRELERDEEAIASFERAVAVKPDYAKAHYNESLVLLRRGDYRRGWDKFEWRWKIREFASLRRDFKEPLWLGHHLLNGKTLLLYAEQNLGDTIQFLRYIRLLARRGATLILEVQAPLKPLLTGLPEVATVLARGEPLPAFDFQCPLLSLPLAFNTRINSIPGGAPYFRLPYDRIAHWRSRIPSAKSLTVGIAWSNEGGGERAVTLGTLAPLLAVPNIRFISLVQQRELRPDEAATLRSNSQFIDLGEEERNSVDVAAMISCVDLVVTPDTWIAHLAGALGRPVWILLPFSPEWRWLLGRDDSVWYPTARLYRQPKLGDWSSAVARVRERLTQFASGPAKPTARA